MIRRALSVLRTGVEEALFMLRTSIYMIAALTAFMTVYVPLSIHNLLGSEALQQLPAQARLQIALPVIAANNLLLAVFIAIIVSTVIDQEKTGHILEYLMVYSRHSIGEYLAAKLVAAILVGALITTPNTIAVHLAITMHTSIDPAILPWTTLSILVAVAAFTLLMLLLTLLLEPRHANLIRLAAMIAALIGMNLVVREAQSQQPAQSILAQILQPLYTATAIVLIASALIYYTYREKIIELAVR